MEDTTEPKTVIVVVWHNGDTQLFYNENADAIVTALKEAEQQSQALLNNND